MIKLSSWIVKTLSVLALITLAACAMVPSTGGASIATATSLPPAPTSAGTPEPAPTTAPDGSVVTLDNDQQTIHLKTGQRFLLNLGMDSYDWTVEIQDQSIVSRVIGITVVRGAQGVYEAKAPGTTVLQASGDPFCRQSQPPCMMPSRLFKVTLVVEQ